MPKDRIRTLPLARDVEIRIERSSRHPIEYAIVLVVEREASRHAVRTFDNAHGTEEHHEHAYRGAVKQPPIVTHGP